MRHQKGRRDCSYRSSLLLGFIHSLQSHCNQRCVLIIVCPILFKQNMVLLFLAVISIHAVSFLHPFPFCPLKPASVLKVVAPGFAFPLNKQQSCSVSLLAQVGSTGRAVLLMHSCPHVSVLHRHPLTSSCQRKHHPGSRHGEGWVKGTVASAELPLLPPSSYFR